MGMARSLTSKKVRGDLVHSAVVIFGFEEMAITIHRHLQAAMSREGLHGLG